MSRRIFLILAAVLMVAVVVLPVLSPQAAKRYVADEFGERHEVIEGGPYVVIKYEPHGYRTDERLWLRYIRERYSAWDRWRMLVERYGGERYLAYVLPCRLLTGEEFLELVEKHRLRGDIAEIYVDSYLIDGTWLGHGSYRMSPGWNVEKALEDIRQMVELSTRHRYIRLYGYNISSDQIVVYIEAFLVNATLRELDVLRKSEDILMVDLPLDLIWRYRREGRRVVVQRLTFGENFLTRQDSCWIKR